MVLPFTREEFFEAFSRYNVDVWPAQWVLFAVGLMAVGVLFTRVDFKERIALASFGLLWTWMGLVYHLQYFSTINPAASVFGVLSLAEGALLTWSAATDGLTFSWSGPSRWLGLAMAVYGLALYPLLNVILGHTFPATPTFGLPCPTTIVTFGLLWWLRGGFVRILSVMPILWAGVGGTAAFLLGVPQDLGLLVAGLVSVPLLKCRPSS